LAWLALQTQAVEQVAVAVVKALVQQAVQVL
jgi:hypothetical protein